MFKAVWPSLISASWITALLVLSVSASAPSAGGLVGESGDETIFALAPAASAGAWVVVGESTSPSGGANRDAFVAQVDAGGTVAWRVYLGGSGFDAARGVAVDAAGNIYVAGQTTSNNFPTLNAWDSTRGGVSDAFLAKLSSIGTVIFSTYLGGSDFDAAYALTLSALGQPVVGGTTFSTDFPLLNPLDASLAGAGGDGFVTTFHVSGTAPVFSTLWGGNSDDVVNALALAPTGDLWLAGLTRSTNFTTTVGADATLGGASDAFLTRFTSTGAVGFSTYWGGSGDEAAHALAVNPAGQVALAGYSHSADFPALHAVQGPSGVWPLAFAARFQADGTPDVSTLLGGLGATSAQAVQVDEAGRVWLAGHTTASDFPRNSQPGQLRGAREAFLAGLEPGRLIGAYLLGGSEDDTAYVLMRDLGLPVLAGQTASADTGWPGALAGHSDGFVAVPTPQAWRTGVSVDDALGNANGYADPGEIITVHTAWASHTPYTLTEVQPFTTTGQVTWLTATAALTLPAYGAANASSLTVRVEANQPCADPLRLHGFFGSSLVLPLGTPGFDLPATFAASDLPQPIPDAGTLISTLVITSADQVGDLRVRLSLTHTFAADADLWLIAPSGDRVELSTDNGGSEDNYNATTFADSAPGSVVTASAPFIGTFRPETPLSALMYQPLSGTWHLQVDDDSPGASGVLLSWELENRAPAPVCLPAGDAAIDGLTATASIPAAPGQPVTFAASTLTGSNVLYLWDFGTATRLGNPVTHIFALPGLYTPTVTASNSLSTFTLAVPLTVDFQRLYLPLMRR